MRPRAPAPRRRLAPSLVATLYTTALCAAIVGFTAAAAYAAAPATHCPAPSPTATDSTAAASVAEPDPTGPWLQYADPADVGFDAGALARACAHADSVGSAAVMAVYRGRVLVACGAVERELELHSVRKSLVSGLYGTAVAQHEIELDATLAELGIDEDAGLTPTERQATVADLLAARSGIFLAAAYAPSSQDEERPERGSHAPGDHWFYNNWDFNVAGVVYERATGEDLYESFDRRIAEPIGMQDYDPEDGFTAYEPTVSRHPAHTFRMSARDLARFGQLHLQDGRWGDRQVIPAEWVRRSTAPVSHFGDGSGYALMWWTYDDGALSPDRYPTLSGRRIYLARGTGSQALWVVPSLDLVIVHRADTDHGRGIGGRDAWGLAEAIAAARTAPAAPTAEARLIPVDPTPFASQLTPYDWPEPVAIDSAAIDPLVGSYEIAPGAVARVFRFQGDPYIHVPGEGDARLIPLGGDTFTLRVVPGVRVAFERDPTGSVEAVVLTLGTRTMRGVKR